MSKWRMPPRAQVLKDGGYFDEWGNWQTVKYTRTEIGRAAGRASMAKFTLEQRIAAGKLGGRAKKSGSDVRKYGRKWVARIRIANVRTHLGYFDTYEEALAARLAAEKKYWND